MGKKVKLLLLLLRFQGGAEGKALVQHSRDPTLMPGTEHVLYGTVTEWEASEGSGL